MLARARVEPNRPETRIVPASTRARCPKGQVMRARCSQRGLRATYRQPPGSPMVSAVYYTE